MLCKLYSDIQTLVAVLLAGSLALMAAAAPSIGMASANGSFRVNHASVSGNSTVFEGNLIETAEVPSEVQLQNGARFLLAAASRGSVYADRAVLDKGYGELRGNYQVEAKTLRIRPATANSVAKVFLGAGNRVKVAALSGSVNVMNSEGMLVASVVPSAAVELQAQAGASTQFQITGNLVKENQRYFLTDETTNIRTELIGTNLEQYVGRRVDVKGSKIPPQPGETGVHKVNVTEISVAATKRRAAAGALPGSGLSTGATVAIVGGVAAGGTVIGLAAAGSLSGKDQASR